MYFFLLDFIRRANISLYIPYPDLKAQGKKSQFQLMEICTFRNHGYLKKNSQYWSHFIIACVSTHLDIGLPKHMQ